MSIATIDLIACEYCDAAYRRVDLAQGERAVCARCGGELYRDSGKTYLRLLPLVLAALPLFVISNAYPIVEMELKGMRTETTLLGAVQALYSDDMPLVALLVCATTILFPVSEMLMLLYLLLPMARGRVPARFETIVRGIGRTRPWGMIEVFMIGALVTLVKLSTTARVLPGIALWSFGALVVIIAAILAFDPRDLWLYVGKKKRTENIQCAGSAAAPDSTPRLSRAISDFFDDDRSPPRQAPTARSLKLVACHACSTLNSRQREGCPCRLCGTPLHRRKPDSLQRTWAFLLAACIFYIPANVLPIMHTRSILGSQQDTILSGIIYLWLSGSYLLALVVLVASIIVPLMKILILTFLLLSVHWRSIRGVRQRTRLYRLVEVIGRWSMLDVFVVALLAALVRAGALATIVPGTGAVAFAAVVVLTMMASLSFDPRLLWDSLESNDA